MRDRPTLVPGGHIRRRASASERLRRRLAVRRTRQRARPPGPAVRPLPAGRRRSRRGRPAAETGPRRPPPRTARRRPRSAGGRGGRPRPGAGPTRAVRAAARGPRTRGTGPAGGGSRTTSVRSAASSTTASTWSSSLPQATPTAQRIRYRARGADSLTVTAELNTAFGIVTRTSSRVRMTVDRTEMPSTRPRLSTR